MLVKPKPEEVLAPSQSVRVIVPDAKPALVLLHDDERWAVDAFMFTHAQARAEPLRQQGFTGTKVTRETNGRTLRYRLTEPTAKSECVTG